LHPSDNLNFPTFAEVFQRRANMPKWMMWMGMALLSSATFYACAEPEEATESGSAPVESVSLQLVRSTPSFVEKDTSFPYTRDLEVTFNSALAESSILMSPNATCEASSVRLYRSDDSENCLSLTYQLAAEVLTIRPLAPLRADSDYELLLTTALRSGTSRLNDNVSVSFTTLFPYDGSFQNPLNLNVNALEVEMTGETTAGLNNDDGLEQFHRPRGLATNGTDLFIADTRNGVIRQQNLATGRVSTLDLSGYSRVNLSANEELFSAPVDLTLNEDTLFVLDQDFHRVLSISLGGSQQVRLIAGGSRGFSDGNGIAAQFNQPQGITNTPDALYVADTCNHNIRRIDLATYAVTSLLDNVTPGCGNGVDNTLESPVALTVVANEDSSETLYVADSADQQIYSLNTGCDQSETYDPDQLDSQSGRCAVSAPFGNLVFTPATGSSAENASLIPSSVATDGAYLYVGGQQGLIRIDRRTGEGRETLPVRVYDVTGLTTDGEALYFTDEVRNQIGKIR
jgi:hypothetical protein